MHTTAMAAAHDSQEVGRDAHLAHATMTDTIAPPEPLRSAKAPSSGDSYDDVLEMFVALHKMPAESREYERQRERIVVRCLPLADHVARRFARRGEHLDDLTQVARLGLMNAINRFDPTKGPSFIGYAVPTMMGEVRRHFRDYTWSMRVPRRLRELHVQIGKATPNLIQKLGRAPTASELAEVLGISREEVVECLVAGDAYRLDSLDAPVGDNSSGKDRMVAESVGGLDPQIDQITNREAVRGFLAALPQRECEVLQMRFFESMTQSQIAQRIGCSQMQVSRILAGTLQRLRDQLE
ncbi:MAG: polymerase sigma-B factor [Mycobacterium sp.]|nr:polymerase sigma-B factor [Mycobacterium sp.]